MCMVATPALSPAVGTYLIVSPCQRRDRDIPLGPGERLQEPVCASPAAAVRVEMKRTGSKAARVCCSVPSQGAG